MERNLRWDIGPRRLLIFPLFRRVYDPIKYRYLMQVPEFSGKKKKNFTLTTAEFFSLLGLY